MSKEEKLIKLSKDVLVMLNGLSVSEALFVLQLANQNLHSSSTVGSGQ